MSGRQDSHGNEFTQTTGSRNSGSRILRYRSESGAMPGRYWLLAGAVVLLLAGLVIQLVIYRSSGINLGRFVLIIGNAALLFIASISLFLMELQRSRRIVRQIRRAKRRRTPGRSR